MNYPISYIHDYQHYEEVIQSVFAVKRTLWIGTADIKDLYVQKIGAYSAILSRIIRFGSKGY